MLNVIILNVVIVSVAGPDSDPQLQVNCDEANFMTVYFLAAMLLHFMRMRAVGITRLLSG
jgi:hypothetical protein